MPVMLTRRLSQVALAFMIAASAGISAQQPPATLAAAAARLAAGDAAGAVAILETVTAADPKNGRAWRNLGAARQQLKDYDKAKDAYLKALEVEPGMPAPLYSLGLVSALARHTDEAFEWFAKARATKKIDMSQMTNAPALAGLKQDPRFAALLPTAEDFAHPFVEDVRVLREWDGESAGDQFGWIARNIGDVDGDGVPDVVTSAPSNNAGGAQAGRIYAYSTKTSKLLWTADGRANDQLGSGVEAAGDTNHDGIPDVIASAPGGDYAKVYSGRDGRELLTLTAGAKGDQFGSHAAGAGDVNGDGFADVIVGAPNNSANGAKAGRAYVFSGKDGSVLLTLTGERAGDNFGNSVTGYSDKKNHFLIVGAGKAGPRNTGRVYVYRGLTETPAFTIDSDEDGNALGAMFVSVLGDVDGDGVPDVYGSDWSNGADGGRQGRVYVHSGKDGHRLFTFSGQTAGEGFGTSPSPAGDVNGDGHADLVVGAWQYAGAAIGGGRAYLYSGKDGHLIRTYTNKTPGDTFGFDAVTMGDIDGDGQDDFLITSGWSAVHGFHSGRVFIISSGVSKSAAPRRAAAPDARYPCRAVHTFDFWAGDFDAKPWAQPDGPVAGQLHNTREYDGCVFVERWTPSDGDGGGMSIVFYDVSRKTWRMIWNDDSNSSSDFEGSYRDGAMRFKGWKLDASGKRVLTSNVLQDVSPDLIRHIFSTSSDGGKTWVVRSDGRFVRRR